MFSAVFGLKGIAIASVVAFLAGGVVGARVTSKYYQSSIYAAKVKKLEAELAARDTAAGVDIQESLGNRVELDRLTEANRELHSKIGPGSCLSRDDTRWLRDNFWKRKN